MVILRPRNRSIPLLLRSVLLVLSSGASTWTRVQAGVKRAGLYRRHPLYSVRHSHFGWDCVHGDSTVQQSKGHRATSFWILRSRWVLLLRAFCTAQAAADAYT